MRRPHILIGLCTCLIVSCLGASARDQEKNPELAVTTKNTADQVEIQLENSSVLIDIHSPTGIGSATFTLRSGAIPEQVVVRLHLRGLEEFHLTSTENTVSISVSGPIQADIHQRLITPEGESPLEPAHPLWTTVDIISPGTDITIPLEEGHFQITLPEEFLQEAGASFEMQWIDFYR